MELSARGLTVEGSRVGGIPITGRYTQILHRSKHLKEHCTIFHMAFLTLTYEFRLKCVLV